MCNTFGAGEDIFRRFPVRTPFAHESQQVCGKDAESFAMLRFVALWCPSTVKQSDLSHEIFLCSLSTPDYQERFARIGNARRVLLYNDGASVGKTYFLRRRVCSAHYKPSCSPFSVRKFAWVTTFASLTVVRSSGSFSLCSFWRASYNSSWA